MLGAVFSICHSFEHCENVSIPRPEACIHFCRCGANRMHFWGPTALRPSGKPLQRGREQSDSPGGSRVTVGTAILLSAWPSACPSVSTWGCQGRWLEQTAGIPSHGSHLPREHSEGLWRSSWKAWKESPSMLILEASSPAHVRYIGQLWPS